MLNKVTGLVFLINSNLNEIYSYFSNSLFTIKQTYLSEVTLLVHF